MSVDTSPEALAALLALPFEQYMQGCWDHVRKLALADPVASVVYEHIVAFPAAMEASWAKRYWFHKCAALTEVPHDR